MKVNFENCQNLIECASRYLYYKEVVTNKVDEYREFARQIIEFKLK